jgi:hypothetical protein
LGTANLLKFTIKLTQPAQNQDGKPGFWIQQLAHAQRLSGICFSYTLAAVFLYVVVQKEVAICSVLTTFSEMFSIDRKAESASPGIEKSFCSPLLLSGFAQTAPGAASKVKSTLCASNARNAGDAAHG